MSFSFIVDIDGDGFINKDDIKDVISRITGKGYNHTEREDDDDDDEEMGKEANKNRRADQKKETGGGLTQKEMDNVAKHVSLEPPGSTLQSRALLA